MSEQNGSNKAVLVTAFLAGAAVGAGISLLLAPKSGEELRGTLKDLAETAREKMKELTAEAQTKIMETFEEGKEKLLEKKSILSSAIEAGREAMAAAESDTGKG